MSVASNENAAPVIEEVRSAGVRLSQDTITLYHSGGERRVSIGDCIEEGPVACLLFAQFTMLRDQTVALRSMAASMEEAIQAGKAAQSDPGAMAATIMEPIVQAMSNLPGADAPGMAQMLDALSNIGKRAGKG